MLTQARERAAPPLQRFTRPGRPDLVGRLSDPGLLEAGSVVLIGLDAIRDRFGAHWPHKCELVWDAAERLFARKLDPGALWARMSEVDFVVCASEDARVSQAMALRVLRELLEFFLGEQRYEHMKIATVVVLTEDQEITCRALDPKQIERSEAEAAAGEPPATGAAQDWSTLTFASPSGHLLKLQFERERVCNLKNGAAIATRLWPTVSEEGTGQRLSDRWPDLLSQASLAMVNTAIVEYAKELYARSRMGVFISCSIHVLSSARNRAQVVQHLESVNHDPARPIIFELLDIDRGTPQSRVLELVSALSPYCRKVVARVSTDRPPLELLRSCRLAGLSVDCGALQNTPPELAAQLGRLTAATHRTSPLTFALNLQRHEAIEAAAAAGATHVGRADMVH